MARPTPEKARLVVLTLYGDETLTYRQIGAAAGISENTVATIIKAARRNGELPKEPRRRGWSVRSEPQTVSKPKPDTSRRAQRKCLHCLTPFMSDGPHERICVDCKPTVNNLSNGMGTGPSVASLVRSARGGRTA